VHSIDEALALILACIPRLPVEDVPLTCALGRLLAQDIVPPTDLWPFTRTAMDGFALRAGEVAEASADHPVRLRVVGICGPGPAWPTGRSPSDRCGVRALQHSAR